VDASRVNEHVFGIRLRVPKPEAEVVLRLPVWIPGSYLVREFARHVLRVSARQGRRPVPISPIDKASWQAACTGQSDLVLDWEIYAFDTSVRAAFLSPQRGFFNGTSVFPAVLGREALPQRVTLLPVPQARWQVTTTLQAMRRGTNPNGFGDYLATNYDELIDHPVEMGTQRVARFETVGVPHVLATSGAGPRFDEQRLVSDTQRICEAAIRLWHPGRQPKPPFGQYAFLLNVVDDGYGGLEHRASTALIASRRDLPKLGDKPAGDAGLSEGYATLLGLISHEYFHTWNVKRLKPREFVPYDLSRENHTELLWFFEGFTSYYDDLLLARAGLVDAARYAKLLSKTVQNVAATPGRKLSSVAQASVDAWLKYYRPDENTPNATVSYYAKGALVALCLDLTLRSEGRTTLDDVLRALWQRCAPSVPGGLDRPMSEEDVRLVLRDLGGRPFDAELDDWVHGTAELPLAPLLKRFGLLVRHDPPTLAQRLGVRAVDAPGGIQIKAVFSGGPAQASGIAAGDELIAITPMPPRGKKAAMSGQGTWRLRKLEDWPLYSPVDDPLAATEVMLVRDQRVITVQVRLPATLGTPTVALDPVADAASQARQATWLGPSLQQRKHLGPKRL
jgi:predicted metalloprotease with PDZ domain